MRPARVLPSACFLVLLAVITVPTALSRPLDGKAGVASLFGTSAPDVLIGTPGADRIHGWMGDDLLRGMDGDDLIVGGGGADALEGGPGNDVIRSTDLDAGVDDVECGEGVDTVRVDPADRVAADCENVVRLPGEGESPPPPSGSRSVVLVDQPWRCTGVVDLDLVKVTMRVAGDAVSIGRGCSGWVGRIEVDTWSDDGVKVQNASPVAQGLVIGGGYVECHAVLPGSHQDGVQAMGGSTLTMRNLTIDCLGNSNFYVHRGGAGASTPTDVVCDGCVFGPRSASTVFIGPSLRSGVRNSVVCQGRYFDIRLIDPTEPVTSGTVVIPRTDPRCA